VAVHNKLVKQGICCNRKHSHNKKGKGGKEEKKKKNLEWGKEGQMEEVDKATQF